MTVGQLLSQLMLMKVLPKERLVDSGSSLSCGVAVQFWALVS
jgi:hypothetical protein